MAEHRWRSEGYRSRCEGCGELDTAQNILEPCRPYVPVLPAAEWPTIYSKPEAQPAPGSITFVQDFQADRMVVKSRERKNVQWSEVVDAGDWSKTTLRASTPAEIEAERQAFARRLGVDPSAVTVHADGTATALVSAEVAAAAAKDAAGTERAIAYLIAQARMAGFFGDLAVIRKPDIAKAPTTIDYFADATPSPKAKAIWQGFFGKPGIADRQQAARDIAGVLRIVVDRMAAKPVVIRNTDPSKLEVFGADPAPGYHQFTDARVCQHCGVSMRKAEERGGTCRFVAEPASAVHVEPALGKAMRKVREFGTVLGAGRWMAPK